MKRLSELIAELKRIEAEHGDVRVYAFNDYEERPPSQWGVNVCYCHVPSPFGGIREPHVQLSP